MWGMNWTVTVFGWFFVVIVVFGLPLLAACSDQRKAHGWEACKEFFRLCFHGKSARKSAMLDTTGIVTPCFAA